MNPYFSPKYLKRRGWTKPVMGVLAFFAVACFYSTYQQIFELHDISMGISQLVLAGLCVFAVFKMLSTNSLREEAGGLANWIVYLNVESISFDKFDKSLHRKGQAEILAKAVKKGFLQNIEVDNARKIFIFHGIDALVQQDKAVTMECPNCGAEVVVAIGKKCVCEYCDSPLIARNNDESEDEYAKQLDEYIKQTEKELMIEAEDDKRENYYNQ